MHLQHINIWSADQLLSAIYTSSSGFKTRFTFALWGISKLNIICSEKCYCMLGFIKIWRHYSPERPCLPSHILTKLHNMSGCWLCFPIDTLSMVLTEVYLHFSVDPVFLHTMSRYYVQFLPAIVQTTFSHYLFSKYGKQRQNRGILDNLEILARKRVGRWWRMFT